jgi:anti-anti-sigma factor
MIGVSANAPRIHQERLTALACHEHVPTKETEDMLRIAIQSLHGVATLYCSGRLIFGVEVEMLRTMAQARQEENIRINLSGVDTIDAAGLGLLVELQRWARDTRRALTLVDLSDNVWRLVVLTKLCAALDITYSDVPAINAREDEYGSRQLIA